MGVPQDRSGDGAARNLVWTGAPVVAGLIGLALRALFLPNAVTAEPVPPSAATADFPGASGRVNG
jgi:hypothetical protein